MPSPQSDALMSQFWERSSGQANASRATPSSRHVIGTCSQRPALHPCLTTTSIAEVYNNARLHNVSIA
jgi:hypothetical protein